MSFANGNLHGDQLRHDGGRPKTPLARTSGRVEPLTIGISMERMLPEDGYSIRLRGRMVDAGMVDLLKDDV